MATSIDCKTSLLTTGKRFHTVCGRALLLVTIMELNFSMKMVIGSKGGLVSIGLFQQPVLILLLLDPDRIQCTVLWPLLTYHLPQSIFVSVYRRLLSVCSCCGEELLHGSWPLCSSQS